MTQNHDLPPLPTLKPGLYRHYKGGEYELLAVAYHSETLAPMVVYRALYGTRQVWVRPAEMWTETVTVNGKDVPRFALAGDVPDRK